MKRSLLKLLPGLCLMLLAGTALAGGVVVSLEGAVPNPQAGEPFDVSFNIFSAHDGSPQDEFHPIVTATNAETGETVTARAEATGPVGHYQATLTLPTTGTWNWQIVPEADYPRDLVNDLTPITVSAPAAVPAGGQTSFAGVPALLWLAVGVVVVGAAAFVVAGRRRLAPVKA